MKLKEVTPEAFSCTVGACPAVYETDKRSFVIIGSRLSEDIVANTLNGKVGPNEAAVEIPMELIDGLCNIR